MLRWIWKDIEHTVDGVVIATERVKVLQQSTMVGCIMDGRPHEESMIVKWQDVPTEVEDD